MAKEKEKCELHPPPPSPSLTHPLLQRARLPRQEDLSHQERVSEDVEGEKPAEGLAQEPRPLAPYVPQMECLRKGKNKGLLSVFKSEGRKNGLLRVFK